MAGAARRTRPDLRRRLRQNALDPIGGQGANNCYRQIKTLLKSAAANNAVLRQLLTERGTRFSRRLPSKLTPGTVAFFATDPDLVHDDFVTHAWVDDPVAWTLSRVPGYRR